jgi:anaerobic magnesium-protoporphyrin IX monomethyl ester cyclase
MRVLLAGPEVEENLSIRYLASSLYSAGHSVEIAPFCDAKDMDAVEAMASEADLVGLSLCFQIRAREFLELARRIKQAAPSRLVVAGGHYASCAARDLLLNHPHIDIVVIHEGEHALVEIADAGSISGDRLQQIRGIAYRDGSNVRFTEPRPVIEDLDSLPPPDRRGPVRLLAGVPTAYVLGSRGCLGSCDYCCISTLHRLAPGPCFRQRATGRIADEMASLYHERGIRQFMFHDDNFLVPSEAKNLERLDALQGSLRRRGVLDIGLVLKCRPADATLKVFGKLRSMGLLRVFLGVESSTPEGLSSIGRRQTVADSERALAMCRQLGISAQFTVMLFHPEATLRTVRSDLAFMRTHEDYPLNFARAEIYAGTPLEKRMIDAGRARGTYLAREYDLLDPAADRACVLAKRIFLRRCWTADSLMSRAIRLDHQSAIMKRFHSGAAADALRGAIDSWKVAVNRDTLGLLERLVDACEISVGPSDPGFRNAVRRIVEEEIASRIRLSAQGDALDEDASTLTPLPTGQESAGRGDQRPTGNRRPVELRAASAVAALYVMSAVTVTVGAMGNEYAPPPLEYDQDGDGLYDPFEREVFRTDPYLKDTNHDGVPDGMEDHDADGVVNLQEQKTTVALMDAVKRGAADAVLTVLAQGPCLDVADGEGLTPLMRAVLLRRVDIIRLLLSAGAEVNARGFRNLYRRDEKTGDYTALMIARESRFDEIVKLLKEAGAAD